MPVMVGRKPPDPATLPPTERDRRLLDALAERRRELDGLMAAIRALDAERAGYDDRIDRLDLRLADASLAGHPKRPDALGKRDFLVDVAMDAWSERRTLQLRLWPVVEKVPWLVRRLTPGGLVACREVWPERVCRPECREDDAYAAIGYAAERAPWQTGTKGFVRGVGRKGGER